MENSLIKKISEALKLMEQGAFQNFCLNYLPLYNTIYKNLERHGGTVEGKTRKGIPDLIITFNTGEQIAVECSVEKNYWKIYKNRKDLSALKPCKDIDRCLNELSNISEIVLCSNQEIPTDSADSKTKIMQYANGKTNAKITLLCCTDIEIFLLNNIEDPNFRKLFEKHLHNVHEWIIFYKGAQRDKLSLELLAEETLSIEVAKRIAEEATDKLFSFEDAKIYALCIIEEFNSRFERKSLPSTGLVVRNMQLPDNLRDPNGIIQSVLGVPKIGKTSLVAACAVDLEKRGTLIHWFNCSIEENEMHIFVKEIEKMIWSNFLPKQKVNELMSGTTKIETLEFVYNKKNPTLIVLDDAGYLNANALKYLDTILAKLKSLKILSQIGVIFISNKRLKNYCPSISFEFSIPAWNHEDLEKLLSIHLQGVKHYNDSGYMRQLMIRSAGHPLIALALAKKYLSTSQLLMSVLKTPSLEDEDLTTEVKNLLFRDILSDDQDALYYVLRLSLLTSGANDEIINIIKNKVKPTIGKPFALILDKLSGTIIDGDEQQGYSISFIYKEIAKSVMSSSEKQEFYSIMSSELLTSKGSALNVENVINGIFYAIFANKFADAFYWVATLLYSAIRQKLPIAQKHMLIERLELVTIIKQPDDPKLLFIYFTVLNGMAIVYTQIGETKKALELLDKIKMPSIKCDNKQYMENITIMNETAKMYKSSLLAVNNPEESIKVISNIDFEQARKLPFISNNIYEFIKILLNVISIKSIPENFLNKIIEGTNEGDSEGNANLINIALNLGAKAFKEKINPIEIITSLSVNSPVSEIMISAFKAQYALENKDSQIAIDLVQQTITSAQNNNLKSKMIESMLLLLQGDAFYQLDNKESAKISYLNCIKTLESHTESFEYAWINYRLGLLSVDPVNAEMYFTKSSTTFKLINYEEYYARSEGERGVTLIQLDRFIDFIRMAELLIKEYFINNKLKYAPTVTILISHLARLVYTLENKAIPKIEEVEEKMICPEFIRGTYASVLNVAKPQVGLILAYYYLGKNYSLLGYIDKAIESFHAILSFETISQLDGSSTLLASYELLNLTVPNGNKGIIKEAMIKCLSLNANQIEKLPNRDIRDFILFCVFSKLDKTIQTLNNEQQKIFIELLDEIEKEIFNIKTEYSNWLLAAIILRKAKIREGSDMGTDIKYSLWIQAYDYGIKADNNDVIGQSGNLLGFIYIDKYPIKLIAETQIKVLKSISLKEGTTNFIEKWAQYLFLFWSKYEWRRLSDSDYLAKQVLLDNAKELNRIRLYSENAGPIMILLLASLVEFKGDATEWAVKRIKDLNIISTIPDNQKNRMAIYLK